MLFHTPQQKHQADADNMLHSDKIKLAVYIF